MSVIEQDRVFRRTAVAVCTALTLIAAGCGRSSPGLHIARIGVVAPIDGGLVQFGRGIRNAVQLAVAEANQRNAIPGWRLEVDAADDSSDPAKGEAGARRLAAQSSVIGVVGTYNSGVATRVIPVLDAAGLAMLSPGNTDPALSLGPDTTHPVRPHATYFRMVAADNVQAPFLAKAAFDDLKARRVAIVSETKPVSKGLADGFRSAFAARGGTVVFQRVVPDGTADYRDVMKAIAPLRPDLVFFGGEYDTGAEVSKQAADAKITAPVMGGDGLKDDAYIAKAGPASEGDLASTVGAPLASLASAKPFSAAYDKAAFPEPPGEYGVYAYDATNLIVAAAARVLKGQTKVSAKARARIVAAIQVSDTTGSSGRLAFDAFGDTQTKVLTLYRVADRAWKATKSEAVS